MDLDGYNAQRLGLMLLVGFASARRLVRSEIAWAPGRERIVRKNDWNGQKTAGFGAELIRSGLTCEGSIFRSTHSQQRVQLA